MDEHEGRRGCGAPLVRLTSGLASFPRILYSCRSSPIIGHPAVSFHATVYRVLIASPGDLQEERSVIEEVVHAWNASHAAADGIVLLPVRWETHSVPEFGDRPQAILNRRLVSECDLLIGAFWTRVGTPTGGFESGTVEEIEQFTRTGKPALLYFSSRQIDPDRVDLDQLKRVRELRSRVEKEALIAPFSSPTELESKLTRHLIAQMQRLRSESHKAPRQPIRIARRVTPTAPDAPNQPTTVRGQRLDAQALGALYAEYWEKFSEILRRSDVQLRPPSPTTLNYARLSLGSSRMRLNAFATVRDRLIGVELILKRPECTSMYDQLKAAREQIEHELGHRLEWKEPPRSYRIALVERGFDLSDRADWERQHLWLIEKLKKYQQVLLKRIDVHQ